MPDVCINYLTIVSTANDDIVKELEHIPTLQINKHGDKAIKVRFKTTLKPDFDWLHSLNKRYNMWWIKNEWLTEDGKAGVWIANGNDIENYEWDDLSLEDEHYYF